MGRAAALASIRAASTVWRADTGTTPASAMTPWCGMDPMQPVITLAAARISRSNTSTLVFAVAGSQAAAACSTTPLT